MLYTDHILASMLQTVTQTTSEGPLSLLYVSDHGQEVGHNRNFAGHSSTDVSGYQVPLLLWQKDGKRGASDYRSALEARPYRTDSLDHTLLGLLGIQTPFYQAEHDILSDRFNSSILMSRHDNCLDQIASLPCK